MRGRKSSTSQKKRERRSLLAPSFTIPKVTTTHLSERSWLGALNTVPIGSLLLCVCMCVCVYNRVHRLRTNFWWRDKSGQITEGIQRDYRGHSEKCNCPSGPGTIPHPIACLYQMEMRYFEFCVSSLSYVLLLIFRGKNRSVIGLLTHC